MLLTLPAFIQQVEDHHNHGKGSWFSAYSEQFGSIPMGKISYSNYFNSLLVNGVHESRSFIGTGYAAFLPLEQVVDMSEVIRRYGERELKEGIHRYHNAQPETPEGAHIAYLTQRFASLLPYLRHLDFAAYPRVFMTFEYSKGDAALRKLVEAAFPGEPVSLALCGGVCASFWDGYDYYDHHGVYTGLPSGYDMHTDAAFSAQVENFYRLRKLNALLD